jgi:nucleoid DNA-binding protein
MPRIFALFRRTSERVASRARDRSLRVRDDDRIFHGFLRPFRLRARTALVIGPGVAPRCRELPQEETEMAGKRLTKSQVVSELAEMTELDKKSINKVFDGLTEIIKKQLGSRGPGEFVIPGLLKLRAVKKPATKDRPGINPFTKQPITIKGKPASKKIRASALKALKDLIQ